MVYQRCTSPLSMLASSTPALASDIFLKIDKIVGESNDEKHKDQIEVLSWAWGQVHRHWPDRAR